MGLLTIVTVFPMINSSSIQMSKHNWNGGQIVLTEAPAISAPLNVYVM